MNFSQYLKLLGLSSIFCLLNACMHFNQQENPVANPKEVKNKQPSRVTYSLCAPVKGLAKKLDDPSEAPLFDNLGNDHYPITTKSELAQTYFNQGRKLANSFNHAEAARSFQEAIRKDPECAMCYWGLAFVLGPNYNAGMEPEVLSLANESLSKAQLYAGQATPYEQDLIRALTVRYPSAQVDDRSEYDAAFVKALKALLPKYPENDDLKVLYVEAVMDAHPWDMWDKAGNPRPWTPEIQQILNKVLAKNPKHAAANHLYIHVVEDAHPEKGIAAADRLGTLMPGAGHLVHMPSHIYIRTGRYHQGSLANIDAIKVDQHYLSACHAAGVYPLAYYPHNYHFLAACAAFEGNSKLALEAAEKMAEQLDTSMFAAPGLGTLQHYYSIPWYVMVKFEKWDMILKEAQPKASLKYPNAIWHYARGMAFIGKNDLAAAEKELTKVAQLAQDPEVAEVTVWDINNCQQLVRIAELVLRGELLNQQGKFEAAEKALLAAIELEDQLLYNEPPDWFFSVRQHLGPIYLANQEFSKAEALYRQDLEKFPETGYALFGLAKALEGQQKMEEIKSVQERLENAWAYADFEL